jgi:hypothetical protein
MGEKPIKSEETLLADATALRAAFDRNRLGEVREAFDTLQRSYKTLRRDYYEASRVKAPMETICRLADVYEIGRQAYNDALVFISRESGTGR